jgi:flagellar biosynthetic protein FlhB
MAETEDRTEQATPRRREKAREEGQLARSRELVAMASTGGVLLVLWMAGSSVLRNIAGLMSRLLRLDYGRDATTVLRAAGTETMLIIMPFFLSALVLGVLTSVLQGGFVMKPLAFNFGRLSPLAGMKNLFSVSAVPGMFKNLLKFVIGIGLLYSIVRGALTVLPATAAMDLPEIQGIAAGLTGKAISYAFGLYFVLAATDYGYERWKFERSIRMSKDEIKEEFRESEGDPRIKSKIKSLQREQARRRMMANVPKATVVITNPTHIAVALEYRKEDSGAPRVIAKGKGFVAEKIRELARKHGIPIVEDKPLARSLYKVKVDAFIPADLYKAVAKILAYIYKMRGAAA